MKKIILKIIDEIAKKHDSTLIDTFVVFLTNIVSGNEDFESVAKKIYELDKLSSSEKEILKDFFDSLKDGEYLIENKEEIIKNFSLFFTQKTPDELALFFTPFISQEALISKDAQKIKKDLSKYPNEIKEAILKSLEMLSISKKISPNEEILKEVLNTIIILNVIMKLVGGENVK